MFLQDGLLCDIRSIETTVYVVTEGDEPTLFTNFFNWDSSKQSSVSTEYMNGINHLSSLLTLVCFSVHADGWQLL